MGLSAPKRRDKLSHDPNNTSWSNSTDGYGQKILLAQGWKPGDYLGARDASHAEHYTAANKSHIKTLLREDGLGLGAQIGKSNAETFGLSLYSGVLSRLNGKSDSEVQKQQSALRDAELRTYQATKYGFMNFVRGGVLVGDSIEREQVQQLDAGTKVSTDSSQSSRKRRKLTDAAEEPSDNHPFGSATDHKSATVAQDLNKLQSTAELSSVEQESKKKSKKKRKESSSNDQASTDPELDKRILKQQKRARKEERRRKKEEKRKLKAEKDASTVEATQKQRSSDAARPDVDRSAVNGSRHAVRHRYIHQKRMASLDPQAMREIFMLKAGA